MLSLKSSQQLMSAQVSKLEHTRHIRTHISPLTMLILPVLIRMSSHNVPIHVHIQIRIRIHVPIQIPIHNLIL